MAARPFPTRTPARRLADLTRVGLAFGLLVPVLAMLPLQRDDLAGLTPGTRQAYLAAKHAAHRAGHPLRLTTGHRSEDRQRHLFEAEVRKRGSVAAARHWV